MTPAGRLVQFDELGITSESAGRLIEFRRDANGRIESLVGPDGGEHSYRYNAQGSLAASVDPLNRETTYIYNTDQLNYLESVDGPLDRTPARVEYDDDGRLTRIISSNGTTNQLTYNFDDQIVSTTDELGRETILVYDAAGNVTQRVTVGGEIHEFQYDEQGRVVAETNALGETTTYGLNSLGFETSVQLSNGGTLRYTYGPNGELRTAVDALGNATSYELDSDGNVLSMTDPTGAITHFEYNSIGDLLQTTDPNGEITTYVRDEKGQPTSIAYADGTVTENEYDELGRLTSTSRTLILNGVETEVQTDFVFDAAGRLIGQTDAEGNSSETQYDAADRIIRTTNALGVSRTFTYSDDDVKTRTEFDDGTTQDYQLDQIGRVTQFTGRGGRVTSLQYETSDRLASVTVVGESGATFDRQFDTDALGRLIGITDLDGNWTQWIRSVGEETIEYADGSQQTEKYDLEGNVTERIDELGRTTRYEYDEANRLIRTTYPDGTSMENTYDSVGRLTIQTFPDGARHRYGYDERGNLSQRITPDGEVFQYQYVQLRDDLPALPIFSIDPMGQVTEYEYDRNGSLTGVTRPDGAQIAVTRNALGEIVAIDSSSTEEIDYETDGEGRLLRKVFADGTTYSATYTDQGLLETQTDSRGTTTHQYDEFDRVVRVDNPDGSFIGYEYDAAGRIIVIETAAGETQYTYDARDRVVSITTDNGGTTNYTYDAAGQVTQINYADGTVEQNTYDANGRLGSRSINRGGTVIETYTYSRDSAGRILSVVELDRSTQYTYSPRGWLLSEAVEQPGEAPQTTIYEYDANGNRTLRDGPAGQTTYQYDAGGRLIESTENGRTSTYQYDSDGRLVNVTDGDTERTYRYNDEGKLVEVEIANGASITIVQYVYDSNGRLVSRIVDGEETRFVVDETSEHTRILEQYDPTRGNVVRNHYVGMKSHESDQNGVITRNWYDGHSGLRRAETSGTVERISYDAFGNVVSGLGSGWQIGFHGEFQDSLTQLTFLRDRFVSNETGRFVTPDDYLPQPGDVENSNLYLFVNNDPLNNSDPSGKFLVSTLFAAAGVVGLSGAVYATALAIGAARSLLTGYKIYNNYQDGREVTGEFENFAVDAIVGGITIADVSTNLRFIRRVVHVKEQLANYDYIDLGVGIGATIGYGVANMRLFLPASDSEPNPYDMTGIGGHAGFGIGATQIGISSWDNGIG